TTTSSTTTPQISVLALILVPCQLPERTIGWGSILNLNTQCAWSRERRDTAQHPTAGTSEQRSSIASAPRELFGEIPATTHLLQFQYGRGLMKLLSRQIWLPTPDKVHLELEDLRRQVMGFMEDQLLSQAISGSHWEMLVQLICAQQVQEQLLPQQRQHFHRSLVLIVQHKTPITVASTETLYAVAGGSGYTDSPVSSATYNITLTAAKPTFSPAGGTYSSTQTVAISTSLGSVICYSTTGSPATNGTGCTSGTQYTSPVTVSSSETLYAVAGATGYTDSPVSSATYNITTPVAATPTFSPVAGTYSSAQTVSISDTTTGAVIYYTTNGATPTTSSAVYSGPITVSSTETLKAIAVATGYSNSAVATAVYTISVGQAATAIFSPAGGTYTSAQTVTIGTTTPSAIIYYTTN